MVPGERRASISALFMTDCHSVHLRGVAHIKPTGIKVLLDGFGQTMSSCGESLRTPCLMSIVARTLPSQLSLCSIPPSSTSFLIARVKFVQSTTKQSIIYFEFCRAMDKNDREKEQASSLLSALYADVIAPDQMAKGFTKLLESVEDLSIDIPDAVELLSLFLARAVVDDILPPAYLARTGEAKLLTKKHPMSLVHEDVLKAEYCWCSTLLSYCCMLVFFVLY
jgi:hypothetical protein